jgi:hypothetical protein
VIWGPFSLCGSRPGLEFPRDFSLSPSITSKTPQELLSKQIVMHELYLTNFITSVVTPFKSRLAFMKRFHQSILDCFLAVPKHAKPVGNVSPKVLHTRPVET